MNTRISIDNLIEIVRTGGKIKTGVDVYNKKGTLLLDKDVLVEKVKILEVIKANGINSVPVNAAFNGGLWDGNGNQINVTQDGLIDLTDPGSGSISDPVMDTPQTSPAFPDAAVNGVERRLLEIEEIKKQASQKYVEAKQSIKKSVDRYKKHGRSI